MNVEHFDLTNRAAIADVLARDDACNRAGGLGIGDDADLLDVDSPLRPAGVVRGVRTARASAIVHVDDVTREASLGWFASDDELDNDASVVLAAACAVARDLGATQIVGPKHMSTWRRYRCRLDDDATSTRAPFLFEPTTPPRIQRSLEQAGFVVARDYATVRIPHVEVPLSRAAMTKALASGVRFTPLEDRSDDDFVDLVHTLAATAFAKKSGYRDVGRDHVAALYGTSRALLVPGLSFVAEAADGTPLGFMVAWPDFGDVEPATVIKTLGISPAAPSFLGWALMQQHVVAARAQGFTHGLYALMEKAGPLLRYAQHAGRMGEARGEIVRRYALFSRAV